MSTADLFQAFGLLTLFVAVLILRSNTASPSKNKRSLGIWAMLLGMGLVAAGLVTIRLTPLGPILPTN